MTLSNIVDYIKAFFLKLLKVLAFLFKPFIYFTGDAPIFREYKCQGNFSSYLFLLLWGFIGFTFLIVLLYFSIIIYSIDIMINVFESNVSKVIFFIFVFLLISNIYFFSIKRIHISFPGYVSSIRSIFTVIIYSLSLFTLIYLLNIFTYYILNQEYIDYKVNSLKNFEINQKYRDDFKSLTSKNQHSNYFDGIILKSDFELSQIKKSNYWEARFYNVKVMDNESEILENFRNDVNLAINTYILEFHDFLIKPNLDYAENTKIEELKRELILFLSIQEDYMNIFLASPFISRKIWIIWNDVYFHYYSSLVSVFIILPLYLKLTGMLLDKQYIQINQIIESPVYN